MEEKLLVAIIGIIFLLIIVFIALLYQAGLIEKSYTEHSDFEKTILSSKPDLSGEIFSNPDFNYPYRSWLAPQEDPIFKDLPLFDPEDWTSDGWYENETVDGRSDIIVIHPLDLRKERFVQRDTFLPEGSYELVVGIADIAGKISYAEPTDCSDVGFLIKIIESGKDNIISDEIINSGDGWVDLSFNITDFAEKSIIIRVESYAGGPCGDWRGEWAAVDYIDVVKIVSKMLA